jgi:hypothetical protein
MLKKLIYTALLSAGFLFVAQEALAGACYVHVAWDNGNPRSSARVIGSVSFGGMTQTVYTDSDGDATLRWSSDNSLSKVFVNGSNYGGCRNGSSKMVVTD